MSTDVLIPVKNAVDLLADCLAPVVAQLDASAGDRVVVIDDASQDGTADRARALGAEVLRLDAPHGPYRARNAGAEHSTADRLIFVDIRSRVLPGWFEAHQAVLDQPGVALSCTNVAVSRGPRLAERISAVVNTFDLVNYLDVPGQLDYFPTCNLGVRRSAFLAVDGFAAVRSGGDADLCWRIQRSHHGRLAADRRVLMTWVPRRSLTQLAEQSFRYGRGHSTLRAQDRADGTAPPPAAYAPGSGARERLRQRLRDHPGDLPAVVGSYALAVPLLAGRLAAAGQRHR